MRNNRLFFLIVCTLLVAGALAMRAQTMTLDQVIDLARTQSVAALRAKSGFVSNYWAWRAYQASRLPSLSLYGNLGNFNRTLNLLQMPETGEMVYTSTYNMQNSVGLRASQNIALTGGTLTLYSDLARIDQFGAMAGKTWFAQPLTLSYSQPLFGYNQFKWDRRISPKEYERARRNYLEDMEDVTMSAVLYYYNVMRARRVYDISRENYDNTTRMLEIARDRLSLGTVTRDEYLQLELSQLRDSIAINDNFVTLREAQMQLNSLLGLDETYEVAPVLEENLPPVQIDYELVLAKCAENSSFELDNEISILNAESAIEQAKANRGITMALNARFGLTNSDSDLARTYKNLLDQEVVGLSFTIPIFDWGLGKGRVRKAEAAADVVRAQVEQAENDKRISLFTAVGQFNNQRQQCDVSRRAADIAAERYQLLMEKFRAGTARVIDLNTARSENDSAMQQYISDISSFWNYYYTLRKLTLYDFINGADLEVDYDELLK